MNDVTMASYPSHVVSNPLEREQTSFIPECEVLYEGGPSYNQVLKDCTKNPGHASFIPVNDLTLNHLPQDYRTETVMANIKRFCDRTVKINVNYTSVNRPHAYPSHPTTLYPYSYLRGNRNSTRVGTGFVEYGVHSVTTGTPCPCPDCKRSSDPKMEYLEVKVQTAAHLVFDDSEAMCTVCELFYDSEDDKDKVKYLYGVSGEAGRLRGARFGAGGFASNVNGVGGVEEINSGGRDQWEKCTRDKFTIKCVTHEKDLFELLLAMYNRYEYGRIPTMIISHPHGVSKRVTFGKILNHTCPLPAGHVSGTSEYTIGHKVTFRIVQNLTEAPTPAAINATVSPTQLDPQSPTETTTTPRNQTDTMCSAYSLENVPQLDTNTTQLTNQAVNDITNLSRLKRVETSTYSPNQTLNTFEKPKNSSAAPLSTLSSDMDRFQRLLNSGNICEPEVVYKINEKMVLRLPPEATYFCRCKPCDGDYDPCCEVVNFPPGTMYKYGDWEGWHLLPDGVEFDLESDRERFGLCYFPYHVVYDMDTCPGCSGALILDENYLDFRLSWIHAGAVPGTPRENRSGCYFSVYSMGWC